MQSIMIFLQESLWDPLDFPDYTCAEADDNMLLDERMHA